MKKYKIIFSPTGGSEKVANAITKSWEDVETIDLTNRNVDFHMTLDKDTLCVIAMPSFGGLAPQLALDRLSDIQANNAKCVIAAVYGNRAYDDTLIQMKDYANKAGFKVIAAISAVAKHSIITDYATSRPNSKDCDELNDYGKQILEKADDSSEEINVPGNMPYKKSSSSMVPKVNSKCTSCKLCIESCPNGAIDLLDPHKIDKSKCIGCMRCVSICPVKARSINPIMKKVVKIALKKACSVDKNNELFI